MLDKVRNELRREAVHQGWVHRLRHDVRRIKKKEFSDSELFPQEPVQGDSQPWRQW